MKKRNLDHKDDWKTPPEFYAKLDNIHKFDFDPCPYQHNIEIWDGLRVDWGKSNFINPPYSQKLKEAFVLRAIGEGEKGNKCVMLLPVSTSTKLFHEHIQPNAKSIEFIKGRIPFIGINSKGQKVNYHLLYDIKNSLTIDFEDKEIPMYVKNSGMHDSMIIIF